MHPVILFDGYCNLCNASVNFVLRHDKKEVFRFAAFQSEAAKDLLLGLSLSTNGLVTRKVDSVILLYKNEIYIESCAGLKIAGLLEFPWNLLLVFKIIPKKIRDRIYKWISKNRYRWFGKRNTCRLPSNNQRKLFL